MADTNESETSFPLAGQAKDGWSTQDEATATCFCGAVQLAFVSLECDSSVCAYIEAGCAAISLSVFSQYWPHPLGYLL